MGRHSSLYTGGQRGFTLIELLVVIAIIGILTSIVLVAIGNSRTTASDTGIKGSLNTIRSQAEVYALSNSNSYGTFNGGLVPALAAGSSICLTQTSGNLFADTTIKAAMTAARSTGGSVMTCYSNGNNWAVAVALKSGPANAWCVDSTGVAVQIVTATALSGTNKLCQS